jgi:hypothetical protein
MPKDPMVPNEIKALSKDYFTLYKQSAHAEALKLDQIAGCGYRKALEFLVKDFAISRASDKAEAIKSAFLGNCISEFIEDANVKKCATLAAWLGNDESHYVRKWEEKDIGDLKVLIQLTEAWILNSLLTEKYVQDMRPAGAKGD